MRMEAVVYFVGANQADCEEMAGRLLIAGVVETVERQHMGTADVVIVPSRFLLLPGARLFISAQAASELNPKALFSFLSGGRVFVMDRDGRRYTERDPRVPTATIATFELIGARLDEPAREADARLMMAHGVGYPAGYNPRDYDPVNMWRWEKWDFPNRKIHVSCPVCYRLTIADIQLVIDCVKIQDSHGDCAFEGYVAADPNGEVELHAWRDRENAASAGGIADAGAYDPGKLRSEVIVSASIPIRYGHLHPGNLDMAKYLAGIQDEAAGSREWQKRLIEGNWTGDTAAEQREQAKAATLELLHREFCRQIAGDQMYVHNRELIWRIFLDAMAAVKVTVVGASVKDGELQAHVEVDAGNAMRRLEDARREWERAAIEPAVFAGRR